MTEIKVGDLVKRLPGRARSILGDRPHRVVLVSRCGNYLRLEGFAQRHFSPDFFEIVPPIPEPAEEGTFLVAKMAGDRFHYIHVAQYKHWPDAEKAAQDALQADPEQATFGVLKLVGTVSMQPRWS